MSWSSSYVTGNDRVRLLDVNLLVALCVDVHVHHSRAHVALRGFGSWATCPITEAALVRLLLNPLTTGLKLAAADVLGVLEAVRVQPGWRFLPDSSSLAVPRIATETLVGTKQVTDFHLVNLAAESDAVLATFDRRLVRSLDPADRRHVEVV